MNILNVKNHNIRLPNRMPFCTEEIESLMIDFNKKNDRDFEKSFRCLSFAMRDNKILEIGFNVKKTNPMYPDYGFSIHAEISLLINLNKNERKKKRVTDIITTRGTEKLFNSFPCRRCYRHLKKELKEIKLWYFIENSWRSEIL